MLQNMCVRLCGPFHFTVSHYITVHYTTLQYTIHSHSYLIVHALSIRVWTHLLPKRAQRNIDYVVLRVILLPRTGKERIF